MKVPYGISNFAELRTEGYFYVDKTRYVELLESLPEKYPVILRSQRFGKTLFANMLDWYYDQRHIERFEEIFKGAYIFEHPTPRRHSYLMLAMNFNSRSNENQVCSGRFSLPLPVKTGEQKKRRDEMLKRSLRT